MDALETASNMSQNARNDLAREAAAAVLEAKEDPDMLNKVVPQPGEKFIPPQPAKVSAREIEEEMERRSGPENRSVRSGNRSIKSFSSAKSGLSQDLIAMHKAQEDAIKRQMTSARQQAETE